MKLSTLIRWILSCALLYGVFTETGVWTTIAMTLFMIFLEMMTLSILHKKNKA